MQLSADSFEEEIVVLDGGVAKSKFDKRRYRLVELDNGLQVILIAQPPPPQEEHDRGQAPLRAAQDGETAAAAAADHDDDDEQDDDVSEASQSREDEGKESSGKDASSTVEEAKKKKKALQPAGVALAVGVGYFADPPELPGLAHYLEHMLFMGTEKFPDEAEWEHWLQEHGGYSNAATDAESTVFYFEVDPTALVPALERFAQFFSAPLFKRESSEREVRAIESEFRDVFNDDDTRHSEVLYHTSDERHPVSKFGWGNELSLITKPAEAAIDVHERLLAFHEQHYHADLMRLSVIGRDLDTMEAAVREYFSEIRGRAERKDEVIEVPHPFPASARGHVFVIEPVRELHRMTLCWAVPSQLGRHEKKLCEFVDNLLGHEGKGSIVSALKGRGWATELEAGPNWEDTSRNRYHYLFHVTITLTESGAEHYLEVAEIVFSYLRMLRREGVQRSVWDELRKISQASFRFYQKAHVLDEAMELATDMLKYEPSRAVYAPFEWSDFDPEAIAGMVACLTADSVRVDVMSQTEFAKAKESGLEVEQQPWFETNFARKPIAAEVLARWASDAPTGRPEEDELHLPAPNVFLPRSFQLVGERGVAVPVTLSSPLAAGVSCAVVPVRELPRCKKTVTPVEVLNDGVAQVFWKLDETFSQPRANVYVRLWNPAVYFTSPQDAVASLMLTRLVQDSLTEETYAATLARLSLSMFASRSGVDVAVGGFSDQLPRLCALAVERVRALDPTQDPARFARVHEELVKDLKHNNFVPYQHAAHSRRGLMRRCQWGMDDCYEAGVDLTPEAVAAFQRRFLSELQVTMLCHGNLSREQVLQLAHTVEKELAARPLHPSQRRGERTLVVPEGTRLVTHERVRNSAEANSAVEIYMQVGLGRTCGQFREGSCVSNRVLMTLLRTIMSEPTFDQLRTKEQLGYYVDTSNVWTGGVSGFSVSLQSADYGPKHLATRVDEFLVSFRDVLAAMNEDEFENLVRATALENVYPFFNLRDETRSLWGKVTRGTCDFLQQHADVLELECVTKEEVLALYDACIVPTSPTLRRITCMVYGCEREMPAATSDEEMAAWVKRLAAYEVVGRVERDEAMVS